MPSFYKKTEGAVISASISKYIYLTVNKKFGGNIRVSYSKTEIADSIEKIQHPIVRESLKNCMLNKSIEISSLADVPAKGTGLGSSSAFTVGLLNALYAFKGEYLRKEKLAEKACDIEINLCKEPIGKQDQYGTAIGGLKELRFQPNGEVNISKPSISKERLELFNRNLLMLYTGKTRSASEILREQSKELSENSKKHETVKEMVKLVANFKYELTQGDINNLGNILHENWIRKISITKSITNSWIDEAYSLALQNGAKGGKILGAGNGGFLLFLAPPERHQDIVNKLTPMQKFDFTFDNKGTEIVYQD